MNKLKLLSSVIIITMQVALVGSVGGCLGNKQPPRHNTVVGEKRVPALNQQTAQPNVPFPTDEMLYQMPQEPKQGLQPRTNWEEPVESNVAPMQQPAQSATNGAAQPSPLYYYEQQNAAVSTSELGVAPSTPAVASVVASGLAPSPLAAEMPDSVPAPMKEVVIKEDAGDYPTLNDVPQKQQLLDKKLFANAKSDADKFIAEQKPSEQKPIIQKVGEAAIPAEPQFDELTLDEFLAKESVEEATKEPVQPISNMDFSKQPLAEVEMPKAEMSKPEIQALPISDAKAKPIPVPESVPMPMPMPMPTIEPFADAKSKQEIAKEMQAQTPPPPTQAAPAQPEIVAVSDAETVAVAPRNQRLYTSGGVIELVPPTSISSRGREIPRSRYYNRRNLSN